MTQIRTQNRSQTPDAPEHCPQAAETPPLDVAQLLAELSLWEKCALLAGRDGNWTVPVPRLGIEPVGMTDGPHGVCAWADCNSFEDRPAATTFPCGAALASTWNPELMREVGRVLGHETRALGYEVLLGPCINIVRSPLGGRNFETYGEDPCLSGEMGVAYVEGLQSTGVAASVKHFACNNQEFQRLRGNSVVDERTLREIYLPAFEAVVKRAQPWTVMNAYNRLNGTYCCDHHWLLTELLRGQWGFDGAVVSDWGSVHSPHESVAAGCDIEMPGPAKYRGRLLYEAAVNWQIEREAIDRAAGNVLRLAQRVGRLGGSQPPAAEANTPEHQGVALRAAAEGITLLKNDAGVLPLSPAEVRTLAVIGPNAAGTHVVAGGSSQSMPPYHVSILDGLRHAFGADTVVFAEGCSNLETMLPLNETNLAVEKSFRAEFYNNREFAGEPAATSGAAPRIGGQGKSPAEGVNTTRFSARYTGQLKVPQDGLYRIQPTGNGSVKLWVNEELAVTESNGWADVELARDRTPTVRLEYIAPAGETDLPRLELGYGLSPAHRRQERLNEAVAAANSADAVLVAVGLPWKFESESYDRPHMNLTGEQDALIAAVADANPNTIVVLNSSAPVVMPWIDEVRAVLLAHYPGMEGGRAIADIVTGQVNPSGRLVVTFPLRHADNPTLGNYPGGRDVHYGERLRVGYRHYDATGLDVLFPFGHGLSYTRFEYGEATAPQTARIGETVNISLAVTNTASRAGWEVVQLYVAHRECSHWRPVKELKRFAKIWLEPGEARTVSFELDSRCFAFWNVAARDWQVEPGAFEILVGASSRDIRSRAVVEMKE